MDLYCGCGCQYQCPASQHSRLFSLPCCQKVRGTESVTRPTHTSPHTNASKPDKTSFSIDAILARDKVDSKNSGYCFSQWKGNQRVTSHEVFCKGECQENQGKMVLQGSLPRRGFITEPTMVRLGRCKAKYAGIIDCEECSRVNELEAFRSGSPPLIDHEKLGLRDDGTPSSIVMELKRCKRKRTIFTAEQLDRLEHEFQHQQYIVGQERKYLARELGLNEIQVKVWFQNRRIKWRKQRIGRGLDTN